MSRPETLYWDACIFLTWLLQDSESADVLEGIDEAVHRVKKQELLIVTSTLTRVEVTAAKLDTSTNKMFLDLLSRREIYERDVDVRVADVARIIRSAYLIERDKKGTDEPRIYLADSVHLATAIASDIELFWTLDGSSKKAKRGDLLRLDSPIAGQWDLRIEMPSAHEPLLFKPSVTSSEADEDELDRPN